ncbi:hypothetical protein M0805_000560 [Coniferiporia weirii]|nr:hypothetical protein M0805_000560 [Coniferiporia weirii]
MTDSQKTFPCGPLLRYTHIDHTTSVWNGSIMVVVRGTEAPGLYVNPAIDNAPVATKLLSEHDHSFWRFSVAVQLEEADLKVAYVLILASATSVSESEFQFWVPAKDETMRMLFHSCNGFSLGVNEDVKPVLWKDVLRVHEQTPLHVMIGGGDQVYSDGVRTKGPLKEWASDPSPRKKARMETTPELEKDLDEWYFRNYCDWYSAEPFCLAAASIPSVQIFDDHDIIDGYGSYKDKWMRGQIFLEIGKVAWKYYMLFQHHTPPEGDSSEDPSWVIGKEQGPYIKKQSRSICTTFGKRVVFFGLDCRTERTLERVCYKSTYDAMFERLDKTVNDETKHLILLLGVPIAYPRLVWLENLLSEHTVRVIRWLNKLLGVAENLFNKFDGSAELLDDLNDHWCAGVHKKERNAFIERLQIFSRDKNVRVTILSGDVHLACVGRFYSRESLKIPQDKDHRYMVNVVSSAITNMPPPERLANFLSKRDKLHKLNEDTHENLMVMFKNEDGSKKGNSKMLAARNYCIITEHAGLARANIRANTGTETINTQNGELEELEAPEPVNGTSSADNMTLAHEQEGGAGDPSAAAPQSGTMRRYALDISIRAELDPKDPEGVTVAYGFSIPSLERKDIPL